MKERTIYNNYNNDEFERQLKEKTDQFKMYPSDKVWNEVHNSLHTRRRTFVFGMSFLIGSILFLAGIQLISPSHSVHSKSITTKINTPAKSAETADLPGFNANGFTSEQLNNAGDHRILDVNQNVTASFILHSGNSTYQQSVSDEIRGSLVEKIQNTARVKPIQTADQNVSRKSEAPEVADLNEGGKSPINPAINAVSAEMVPEKSVNQLTHIHDDRFSWEIYITPTLNTHYLYGLNYRTMAQAIPSAPIMVVHIANVNGFVDNTPVLGYDVGGNILYRISKNISLKAGLEFSFSRYYINAYNSNPGQASVTLASPLGYIADSLVNSGSGTASINKNPEHYQNRYYQLSVPVGVDMKVVGKGKLQLHLGATLQPSYLLNTDAYVLSDDYSTYIKDPQAFRRWNLIAGAETYISYGVGKIRWEIGPQVRYQIFSTYKNNYPLQENMLNYGIRIGISKSIW